MKKSPLLAATLVALAGVAAVAHFAAAGASFLGQGTVPFDGVKIGRKDADKIQLNGTVLNSRTGKPVLINDDVSITGNLLFPNDKKGWIKAPGANNIVGIDDDAQITGGLSVAGTTTVADLNITGALLAGSTDFGQLIVDDAALTSRLGKFTDCVATLAQYTTEVASSDYIFCFNTWLAGKPVSVLSTGAITAAQREQLDAARAFAAAEGEGSTLPGLQFAPKHQQ